MRTFFRLSTVVLVVLVAGIASAHQRKEMSGMLFVFGGDREPNLDNEVCYLEWTVSDLETKEPVTTLKDVSVKIKFYGKEFGPFQTQGSRANPGMYRTRHIFTGPGEGEATITFKKEGEEMEQSLMLTFRINPRKVIEIP